MIVNHVFIGRGPAKASDLFNVLTWASLGATVNLYVSHPDKQPTAEQHSFASLFHLKQDLGNGVVCEYPAEHLFALYTLVDGQARGVADRVKLISLPATLAEHEQAVPGPLKLPTLGWKTGILKFLSSMSEWWPVGKKMDDAITERLFSVVDATKFYLAATKQGIVCDMKVGPTPFFPTHEGTIGTKFISFQRGNAGAAGFENQLSGSMCEGAAEPRLTYAKSGQTTGDGFGSKTVTEAARYFEKITAAHGKAMGALVTKSLGIDSTQMGGSVVPDPQSGWKGPVCVYKHPRDQSWAGRTLSESEKSRAKTDIDQMAAQALKMVLDRGTLGVKVREAMVELTKFPGFNIYA